MRRNAERPLQKVDLSSLEVFARALVLAKVERSSPRLEPFEPGVPGKPHRVNHGFASTQKLLTQLQRVS